MNIYTTSNLFQRSSRLLLSNNFKCLINHQSPRLCSFSTTTASASTNEQQIITKIYDRIIGNRSSSIQIKDNGTKSGRGLFAITAFKKGSQIFQEEPFVSYPSLDVDKSTICNHCLKQLNNNGNNNNDNKSKQQQQCTKCGERYCSEKCRSSAEVQHHLASCPTSSNIDNITRYSLVEKRRFPLLAARILSRILLENHFDKTMHNWENLQVLSFAKKDAPLEWKDDYDVFKKSLLTRESNQKRFDFNWFVRIMQILYLNTLGIDVGSTKPSISSPTSSIGLFFLSSFFNHSCDPNVYMAFPHDKTAVITALRDIKKGEELFISYGDSEKDMFDRQTHLFDNYGFNCDCPKCTQELLLTKQQRNK
ncbi:SET domain-containing protein [Cavenderia fasciculata]|uniref:SET domain-containing protein n=1 Tax=Cavenderia fasciculata TaxID=261658 RepID=F4Q491_CACFS|nr:SET domain-containing protein [Cavenderia fasciculata]EGG17793.1 SET domain-containing protein [Cavenderia fasciculata]|eukprot:XP_004356277.1 SET domain-containing protein [Cavenderia fasciculata]